MNDAVEIIPIDQIRIINPRHRDRKKFEVIVRSIGNLGLMKPIQVGVRSRGEDGGKGYDLVCGQGRIEAFQVLGHTEIPAIVVEVSREERLLRSLVENMARRMVSPYALMVEILRLKKEGYIRKLLENGKVVRFLNANHADLLSEFEAIAAADTV